MHKTGTSSIKNMLFNSLDDKRFSYANLGVENQSMSIFCMFADKPEKYHACLVKGWSLSDVEEYNKRNMELLLEGFGENNNSVKIFSGESIVHFSHGELIRFKEFLGAF